MEDQQIIKHIDKALELLTECDSWLLKQDLSEQSISHKLAEHLQTLFSDFHVDCEYNGNVDRPNGKKKIFLVKESCFPRHNNT